MKPFKPHSYQREAIEFMKSRSRCALFIPVGGGKTACSLSYVCHQLQNNANKERNAGLVVMPKSLLANTWQAQIKNWQQFNHLTCKVLHGSKKQEVYDNTNPDLYLINYEGLDWLVKHCLKSKKLKFNTIIFDESSKLKSWRSERFKICRKLCFWVDNVVMLTATPTPTHFLDLWAQMFLLDRGESLGRTLTSYKSQYFYEEGYRFKTYHLKPNAKEQILKKISKNVFRVDDSEIQNVDLHNNIIPLKLTSKLQKQYKTLEEDMFYVLNTQTEDVLKINSKVSATGKCRQFIQGFLYKEDIVGEQITKTTILIHDLKINRLLDLIEEFNGESVLLAYSFRQDYYVLKEALKNYRVAHMGFDTSPKQLKENEHRWNNKEIQILLCNPASVSHGLNLQEGGHNVVWYGLTYNWEHYTQLVGRLHRQGQKNIVRNHILLMENTVDEAVYSSLQRKEHTQKDFLKCLYEYQKAVKN